MNFNLTWAEWLSIVSVVIALLALVVNFSKFFTDLVERREKRKKEEIERQKARIVVTYIDGSLIFENKGLADAYIKNIMIGGKGWEEIVDKPCPSLINSEQTKMYDFNFSGIMEIEYADDYSRSHLGTTITKEYEL
ncbi:hypothetical protein J7E63_12825 [Bacillus sp. ISL-75]|uniref:hypothetical protein n=1 Tax=Bacillus sp. ISL-75 TaxID=2819137 RepID=UPI001BE7FC24|nr:hypothetical protein [Bacillus sp. ISL-75]MBT2727822.1 hypothetical protein [Bacillus sp. ISL-75]